MHGNKEKEAFADIFVLESIGDKEKLEYLKTNFPGLMEAYNKLSYYVH